MFFVRKSKIFNKNRYSRNRQNVRVTFYFAVYFNILIIYTVYSLVYEITFFFHYIWWIYYLIIFLPIFYFYLQFNK